MALTFNGSESWRWDRRSQEVRLSAWLGSDLILCRVSRRAVEVRCGNSPSPCTCLRVAKEHFDEITARLDAVQDDFKDSPIETQYFSQSSSYASAAKMIGNTVRFLLIQAYDLAIEKRFTLDVPKAPIQIVIEEYGSLGENDVNLDLFISANGLKGDDILYLPAGREVLTYV